MSRYIQPRDLEFLGLLLHARILTLKHTAALIFNGNQEGAKKRVQKLKAVGLVLERRRKTYEPGILFLSKRGFQCLGDIHAEQASKGHCLSIPLFLKASTAYFSAHPRIVFVGQETHGWWTNCPKSPSDVAAAEIMDFYEREWLELYRNYKSSPYWRAMRHIVEAFQLDALPYSFLCSNIFPCDLDKQRAPVALHDIFRRWKLLPEELHILEPAYVIFFCGREYYGNLESFFGEWPREFVSAASPLVQYQPPNCNWKGFVTYHPAYLQRSNQWNILDKIIALIKEDLADVPPART